MTEEKWIQWEPTEGLAQSYYIETITDDPNEGLKIILSDANDEEKRIQVIFEKTVCVYQSTNESFRLKTISALHKQPESKLYDKWTFFKVINSSYLQIPSKQSFKTSELQKLIHFSIFGIDSIVDVIATYEPKVEFVRHNNNQEIHND